MKTFEEQVTLAEKRVADMDKVDGFKDRHWRTILLALESGLRMPESGAQFDAYVMLQEYFDENA